MAVVTAPKTANALVRLELVCRVPDGVDAMCAFIIERWLPTMYPGAVQRRIAAESSHGARQVRVKDIATRAGSSALCAAVARVDTCRGGASMLSLISWASGEPFGFGPVGGDETWVTVAREGEPGSDVYRVYSVCAREKTPPLIGVTVKLGSSFEVVSGGGWSRGGFRTSWVDRRWKVPVLRPPGVIGPMWLMVAPMAANRLLAGSEKARQMAVSEHPLPDGGAVWQLSAECDGPIGDELEDWMAVLTNLGVWSAPSGLS